MAPSKVAVNIRGSAAYKKKDGTLSISKDQASILWIPIQSRDATSSVTINVTDIISRFQEAESRPRMRLIPDRFAADSRVSSKGDAEDL
jgi:transcription initiation factor TFIIH subunit 1